LSYVRVVIRRPLFPSAAWEKLLVWGMALNSRLLASGPGWSVSDVACTAGPHDRPFEERHHAARIPAVIEGTVQYLPAPGPPWRRAAGRRRELLRMRPRARNRRPLPRLPLHAWSSGSDRGSGTGRTADDVCDPGAAAVVLARAVARRRGGRARRRRQRRVRRT